MGGRIGINGDGRQDPKWANMMKLKPHTFAHVMMELGIHYTSSGEEDSGTDKVTEREEGTEYDE